MRIGKKKSCGCLARGPEPRVIPAGRRRARRSWEQMRARCYSPSNHKYGVYGARGITVCEAWRDSFEAFYRDMGDRPEGTTLGRIDNDGNYEPNNCRWETAADQAANRSDTVWIEVDGKREKLVDAARRAGLPRAVVYGRLKMGWPVSEALSRPLRVGMRKLGRPKIPETVAGRALVSPI